MLVLPVKVVDYRTYALYILNMYTLDCIIIQMIAMDKPECTQSILSQYM